MSIQGNVCFVGVPVQHFCFQKGARGLQSCFSGFNRSCCGSSVCRRGFELVSSRVLGVTTVLTSGLCWVLRGRSEQIVCA